MGSNVQILTISIRSTPDVLLSLFVLLSLWGFARILFEDNRAWSSYALAWVGAGLAVQTKGLLGICPVCFAVLFCALSRQERTKLRSLFEWKAVILGLAVALFWYVVTVRLHGRQVIVAFFADQVTDKVSYSPLTMLQNMVKYFGGALRHFLPWTLLLGLAVALDWRVAGEFIRSRRRECLFLVGWFLALVAVFSFGNMLRTRYLAASYPMLAVLAAGLLARCAESARFEAPMGRVLAGTAAVLSVGGAALLTTGLFVHWRVALAGLLMLFIALTLFGLARTRYRPAYWLAVACLPLAFFCAAETLVRPVFAKSAVPELVTRLSPQQPGSRTVYAWQQSPVFRSQLRVVSAGRLQVEPLDTQPGAQPATKGTPVIFSEASPPHWTNANFVVERAALAGRSWKAKDFRALIRHPSSPDVFVRNQIPFYIATDRNP